MSWAALWWGPCSKKLRPPAKSYINELRSRSTRPGQAFWWLQTQLSNTLIATPWETLNQTIQPHPDSWLSETKRDNVCCWSTGVICYTTIDDVQRVRPHSAQVFDSLRRLHSFFSKCHLLLMSLVFFLTSFHQQGKSSQAQHRGDDFLLWIKARACGRF